MKPLQTYSRQGSAPRFGAAAFTLVELLVVIGIIALLIGILLPTLTRAREAGKAIKCKSNLHQISVAFESYLADSHGQGVHRASLGTGSGDRGPAVA